MPSSLVVIFILAVTLMLISSVNAQEQHLGKHCSLLFSRRDCGDNLICNPTSLMCAYCSDNDQCNEGKSFSVYQCKNVKKFSITGEVINQGLCQHKAFFTPYLHYSDVLAFIVVFIVNCVASSGGIGGGGIFVPVVSFFTQMGAAYTIPISKTIFFGSSLFNFLAHVYRAHPTIKTPCKKPVIDYEAALLILPLELLGTTLGVLLNLILPEWLIVILMILVIGYTIYKTATKGYKEMKKELAGWRKETKIKIGGNSDPSSKDNFEYSKMNEETIEDSSNSKTTTAEMTEDSQNIEKRKENDENPKKAFSESAGELIKIDHETMELDYSEINKKKFEAEMEELRKSELDSLLKSERSFFPIWKILLILLTWGGIFLVALLRGGSHGFPSIIGIPICSWAYWMYFIIPWPIVLAFAGVVGFFLYEKNCKKQELKHQFEEGELQWNIKSLTILAPVSIMAGALSALVGLGAGSLILPIYMEMGAHATAGAATINLMILLSASSQAIQFYILGRIQTDYGIVYFIGGFISAFIGQIIIGWPAHKYHMSFILIYSIVLTLVAALFMMGGIGIYHVIQDIMAQAYLGFKSPCH